LVVTLDIYTGSANWVIMTKKNMLYDSMEQVCRLINKIYEDECTGVSRDNYVVILAILMVLVHLWCRWYYIFCGCTNGGGGKRYYILLEVKVGS
jgi:hypothetical protein